MRSTFMALVLVISLVGCGDSGGTDGGMDATMSGMCPATAPAAGGACSLEGLQCGPFPYGHADCLHPGQMTTGYEITATFTCTGGTWNVQTMSQGSCSDN